MRIYGQIYIPPFSLNFGQRLFLLTKDDYKPKYAPRLVENASIKSGTDKK